MLKKQVIRINENQLKQIVKESVERVLNEGILNNIMGGQRTGAGSNANQNIQNRSQISTCLNYLLKFVQNAVNSWNNGGYQQVKNITANMANAKKYVEQVEKLLQQNSNGGNKGF